MGFIPYLIRRIKIVGANGKDKWGSIILPKLNSIGWRYVQFKFIGLEAVSYTHLDVYKRQIKEVVRAL